jgi:hypothetical protein
MSIARTAQHTEILGGKRRPVVLTNAEIERFEVQHAPYGIFDLWNALFERGPEPQVRHVRDLVALALVGGGMADRQADDLVADLPPGENLALREIARRILGVAFIPAVLDGEKKNEAGSPSETAP